jgi:hypothetical protein
MIRPRHSARSSILRMTSPSGMQFCAKTLVPNSFGPSTSVPAARKETLEIVTGSGLEVLSPDILSRRHMGGWWEELQSGKLSCCLGRTVRTSAGTSHLTARTVSACDAICFWFTVAILVMLSRSMPSGHHSIATYILALLMEVNSHCSS